MDFPERLSALLHERDITAYRLRKDLKLGNSVVAYWLDGTKYPDGKNLIGLADYFDVSLDYLVGRDDIPIQKGFPMNNDEKILSVLETVVSRLDAIEANQADLKAELSYVKEDIEIIKEDTEEIRSATNTLLDWAERAEIVTKVKLVPRSNQM